MPEQVEGQMSEETRAWLDYLAPLVGYTVDGLAFAPADEFGDEFFGLTLVKGKERKVLWILADEEGNGPGAVEIMDNPSGCSA